MKPTLAIYGIQDRSDNGYPEYIHDHSIVLMQNGKIIKFAELERITRKKHDNSMHKNIESLLRSEKLINTIDYDIVFVDSVVGRSFISQSGQIRFEAPLNNKLINGLEKGRCWWFGQEKQAWVLNHELAHVYSCIPFYDDFKDNSLLIHFDGGASLSNVSAWHYKNKAVKLIEYNWDLKYISALFNANALNFLMLDVKRTEHNSLPGKFMGYASYGKYDAEIEKWLNEHHFFYDIWHDKNLFFKKAKIRFNYNKTYFDLKDKLLQDIAATVQHVFTRTWLEYLSSLKKQTNAKSLYYTGGSALNIVTNRAIENSGYFENVYVPPCTNDTGLAIGAATYLELKKNNTIKIHSPYLNNWNIDSNSNKSNYPKNLINQITHLLLKNKIIGIYQGFGESGPRALGNRSIIALPNSKELAKKISMECKKREWYRPLAPIMLKRNIHKVTNDPISELNKYMLIENDIKNEFYNDLQGVIHIDGTARIQYIESEDDNYLIYHLLNHIEKEYNILALINTSFNQKGEPMVHTADEALKTAKKMSLDAIIINNKIINLHRI